MRLEGIEARVRQVQDAAFAVVEISQQRLQTDRKEHHVPRRHDEFRPAVEAAGALPELIEKRFRPLQVLDDVEQEDDVVLVEVDVDPVAFLPREELVERVRICGRKLVGARDP